MQLLAGQLGGERSLRGASGDADGVALPDIGQLVLRSDHVRPLGQLRRAQLHRQHPQSLHDIRRSVSSKLITDQADASACASLRYPTEFGKSRYGSGSHGRSKSRHRWPR